MGSEYISIFWIQQNHKPNPSSRIHNPAIIQSNLFQLIHFIFIYLVPVLSRVKMLCVWECHHHNRCSDKSHFDIWSVLRQQRCQIKNKSNIVTEIALMISKWISQSNSWVQAHGAMIRKATVQKTIGYQHRWGEEGDQSWSRHFPAHFEAFSRMTTVLLWIGNEGFESSFSLVHVHHLINQTQNQVVQTRTWTTDGLWTSYTRMNSTEAELCERSMHQIEWRLNCSVEWTKDLHVTSRLLDLHNLGQVMASVSVIGMIWVSTCEFSHFSCSSTSRNIMLVSRWFHENLSHQFCLINFVLILVIWKEMIHFSNLVENRSLTAKSKRYKITSQGLSIKNWNEIRWKLKEFRMVDQLSNLPFEFEWTTSSHTQSQKGIPRVPRVADTSYDAERCASSSAITFWQRTFTSHHTKPADLLKRKVHDDSQMASRKSFIRSEIPSECARISWKC
jgi:hypothetical protein